MKSTRQAYGETLLKLGENKAIVVLDADVSSSTKTNLFMQKYPDRFFNNGIAEADMIGQAAGFAVEGFVPFVSTFAAFLTGRVYDQIRASICYSNLNVKLVSTHAGLTVGEDGATHQMLEDIALTRALPNMNVYTASTAKITEALIHHIYQIDKPCYLRLYRLDCKEEYEDIQEKELKKAIKLGMITKGNPNTKLNEYDLVLITMGDMTNIVYEVQKNLLDLKINALVIDVFRLKPFNTEYLLNILENVKKDTVICTIEDHTIYGGLRKHNFRRTF